MSTVRSGGIIARTSPSAQTDIAPGLPLRGDMRPGFKILPGLGSDTSGSGTVVRAEATSPARGVGPTRISSGVSAGLLLQPIRPVYPAIAKASHTEGTIILTATIDKAGRITNLQVVSGPLMLRRAALEAVESARYRPFLLNGESTEVVTTISVVFSISG